MLMSSLCRAFPVKPDLTSRSCGAHDFYHLACPLRIDRIPGRAANLEVCSDNDAVRGGEDVGGIVMRDPGIGENRDIAGGRLCLAQLSQAYRRSGLRAADQQRVHAEK